MQRIEVNVVTGEQIIVDLTPEEIEQALAQQAAWEAEQAQIQAQEVNPVDKLKAFLAANPDVAALM
jgi:precorrin-6B methylase 2